MLFWTQIKQLKSYFFTKHDKGMITCLIMYVDDMIVMRNDSEQMRALQNHLA
jgi:hypothetical protein